MKLTELWTPLEGTGFQSPPSDGNVKPVREISQLFWHKTIKHVNKQKKLKKKKAFLKRIAQVKYFIWISIFFLSEGSWDSQRVQQRWKRILNYRNDDFAGVTNIFQQTIKICYEKNFFCLIWLVWVHVISLLLKELRSNAMWKQGKKKIGTFKKKR